MTPCPVTYALTKIGGKWKIPILCALKINGPTRYNELMRLVNGITHTMLASSLKELEQDGLVERKQYNEIPVRVEYSTTEKGDLLVPVFKALSEWSIAVLNEE